MSDTRRKCWAFGIAMAACAAAGVPAFAESVESAIGGLSRGHAELYELGRKNPKMTPAEAAPKRDAILGPRKADLARAVNQSLGDAARTRKAQGGAGASSTGGAADTSPVLDTGGSPQRPSRRSGGSAQPDAVIDGKDIPSSLTFPGAKSSARPGKGK